MRHISFDRMTDFANAGLVAGFAVTMTVAGFQIWQALSTPTGRDVAINRLSIPEKVALVERSEAHADCGWQSFVMLGYPGAREELTRKLEAGSCMLRTGNLVPPKHPACYPLCPG